MNAEISETTEVQMAFTQRPSPVNKTTEILTFAICFFVAICDISKHLKGQLDPPVSNGQVFCTKGGQLDPPVSNGHVFCTKGGQFHGFSR